MKKLKYYYDTETLSYKRVETSKSKRLGLIALFVISVIIVSIVLFISYLNIPSIETPKEKAYKRELRNMKLEYESLNKQMDQMVNVLEDIERRDNKIYRVYFEADPIPEEQRNVGFGGVNRYNDLKGYNNSELLINTNRRVDKLKKRLVVQSRSLDKIKEMARNKEAMLKSIPAIQPVPNDDLKRISAGYGYRMHPILKYKKLHEGIDFSAPVGTPVYATGNGVIREARRTGGYGKLILLDHGFGYKTFYAHLSKFNVSEGQKVKRGDVIGELGNTGLSTGPHLHYEVHKDNKIVNPINYFYGDLSPKEYSILRRRAAMQRQSLD